MVYDGQPVNVIKTAHTAMLTCCYTKETDYRTCKYLKKHVGFDSNYPIWYMQKT